MTLENDNVDDVVQNLEIEISTHPFVKGMRPEHLRMLALQGARAWFDPDQPLLKEAGFANRFYLIQEGKVALEVPMEESAPIFIEHVGAGDELGWSWLFPEHYFRLDARAIEPTRAVSFFGPALLEQCARDHDFGYELAMRTAGVLMKQLKVAREKLVDAYQKF